jgi:hypothetical protein
LAPDGALYVERVMQANTGADLEFLDGLPRQCNPAQVALDDLVRRLHVEKRMKRIS